MSKKNFSQKNCVVKKSICVKNNFWNIYFLVNKILGQKIFDKKELCLKNFESKKEFESQIILGSINFWTKNFWVKKISVQNLWVEKM